jgi:hypothetical protein
MRPDAAGRDMLHKATGIYPMQTATGMRMFHAAWRSGGPIWSWKANCT